MEVREFVAKLSARLLRRQASTQPTHVRPIIVSLTDRRSRVTKARQTPPHRPRPPCRPASNM